MENISPYGTVVVAAAFMGLGPTGSTIRDRCANPCKNMLLYFIYKVNTCKIKNKKRNLYFINNLQNMARKEDKYFLCEKNPNEEQSKLIAYLIIL